MNNTVDNERRMSRRVLLAGGIGGSVAVFIAGFETSRGNSSARALPAITPIPMDSIPLSDPSGTDFTKHPELIPNAPPPPTPGETRNDEGRFVSELGYSTVVPDGWTVIPDGGGGNGDIYVSSDKDTFIGIIATNTSDDLATFTDSLKNDTVRKFIVPGSDGKGEINGIPAQYFDAYIPTSGIHQNVIVLMKNGRVLLVTERYRDATQEIMSQGTTTISKNLEWNP